MIRCLLILAFVGTMALLPLEVHRDRPTHRPWHTAAPRPSHEHLHLLVARWRHREGLSMAEAAARVGLSVQEWRQIEEGSLILYGPIRTHILQCVQLKP